MLERLLSEAFPGRGEISQQVENCSVQTIDEEGSVRLMPRNRIKANVLQSIPTEAEAEDQDGVTVHALLHVKEGVAHLVEFYKDDGSPIIKLPDATTWRVVHLPPPPPITRI
jgi:uncharacterized protein DUF6984